MTAHRTHRPHIRRSEAPTAVAIFAKFLFQNTYFNIITKKIAKTFGQFKNNA